MAINMMQLIISTSKTTNMLRVVLLSLLFTFCEVLGNPVRIVNGTDAKPGEFPWAVSLQYTEKHFCGGSILDEYHILTAAHCVYKYPYWDFTVVAGQTVISGSNVTRIRVQSAVYHNQYKPSIGYDNDIAILSLIDPIPFNQNTKNVTLPPKEWYTPGGMAVTVVGWGYNETNGSTKTKLKKVQLTTLTGWECSNIYGDNVSEDVHLCAGQRPGYAHCSGDSGGPLVGPFNLQLGIVSWSYKPCGVFPGVYTNVLNYIDWIEKNRHF